MELLNPEEIRSIVKPFGASGVINWSIENYSNESIGYLGDHLRLRIEFVSSNGKSELQLFVKCIPRFDEWRAQYLKDLCFFKKEYIMLSSLFPQFKSSEESYMWRPEVHFIKENLFVFEDVAQLGYRMPNYRNTLSHEEIMATVKTVAKFHAQSFILEEKKSKELNREYRIWEDYSEYLQEPTQGKNWRDTGRKAAADYLKVYSRFKTEPNFNRSLEVVLPMLFERALTQMKPSTSYRNVVVHRDLWTNNIFFKRQDDGQIHAMLVDFQTVLYASPMLDISSLLFFNTMKSYRDDHTREVVDFYYEILSSELKSQGIDVNTVFNSATLYEAYEDSVIFGIIQAAIIVPMTVTDAETKKKVFLNPETTAIINEVSRSREFIEAARQDEHYRNRVTDVLDEIVQRFIITTIYS